MMEKLGALDARSYVRFGKVFAKQIPYEKIHGQRGIVC